MPETLDATQIEFYRDNGYLVLENRVPMAIIEEIRAEITRFAQLARGMSASDDKIDLEALQLAQRIFCILGRRHHEAVVGEVLVQQVAQPRIVIDDEDMRHGLRHRFRRQPRRIRAAGPSPPRDRVSETVSSSSIMPASTLRKPSTASAPASR